MQTIRLWGLTTIIIMLTHFHPTFATPPKPAQEMVFQDIHQQMTMCARNHGKNWRNMGLNCGKMTGSICGAALGSVIGIPLSAVSLIVSPLTFALFDHLKGFVFGSLLTPIIALSVEWRSIQEGWKAGEKIGSHTCAFFAENCGKILGAGIALFKNAAHFHTCLLNHIQGTPLQRKLKDQQADIIQHNLAALEQALTIQQQREDTTHSSCSICLSSTAAHAGVQLRNCDCEQKHICNTCQAHLKQFLLSGNSEGLQETCPGGCGQKVTTLDLYKLGFTSAERLKVLQYTYNKLIPQVQNFYPCPNPDCIHGAIAPDPTHNWHCELCQFQGCIKCGESSPSAEHICNFETSTIEQTLTEGRKRPCDEHPTWGTIRPCYWCGKLINRMDGCNTVKCTACQKNFHWNTGIMHNSRHDFHKQEMQYEPLQDAHF
ncbi:MAG: hypothetical protein OXT67_01570 [Zetaproteobacteria bacterium]|nr:hypothetical protein [Zetaproteobacteria bacterium]